MKIIFLRSLIAFLLLTGIAVSAYAQVNLDGTIGTAGKLKLPGPDYDIKADYGKLSGKNLFHSFETFNISTGESANFTGPDSVQNIISRVTGGDASWIDGTLRSAIPDANLYLLNSAGVMFGPNASLDLRGSFHVSTADYLRMGNNEQFYSMAHENNVLSAEAPTAFGFLDDDVAPISIEGRGEITALDWFENPTGLYVPKGNAISVIGGNIEIKNGTFFKPEDEKGNKMFAYQGNWTLISDEGFVGVDDDTGHIIFYDPDNSQIFVDPSLIEYLYPVTEIKHSGEIKASEGLINIAGVASAGEVIPTESDLDVSSCKNLGNIDIYGKSVIDVSGEKGGIYIRGGDFLLDDSAVHAYSFNDAGNISIETERSSFANGALISGSAYGYGVGGNIVIRSSESVSLYGNDSKGQSSVIEASAYNKSDAGNVVIETKNLSLKDDAQISTASLGLGNGGNVTIKASESVIFSDSKPDGYGSSIVTVIGEYADAGKAGDVLIETKNISLNDGAWIGSYTEGKGKGGDITICASESVNLSGINNKGNPSIISAGSAGDKGNAGDAGDILIKTKRLTLSDRGTISTQALNAGGGKITINADEFIRLSNGSIVTSVKGGTDDAGDISIENPAFFTMNHSNIKANANEGKGGNIDIVAGHFIQSYDSIVNASSEKGIDGIVDIKSPDEDITRGLTVLPENFPDADHWMKTPCPDRSGQDVARFVISGQDGIPTPLDDFLASPPMVPVGLDWEKYYRKGDYEKAVLSLEQAVSRVNAEQDTGQYLEILMPLVSAYQAIGHHKKALSHLKKALPLVEKTGEDSHKALFFSMFGDLHLSLGKRKKAEKYLQKGMEQARVAGNPHILASVLNNMGIFLAADGDYDEAAEAYKESLELLDAVHGLPVQELKSKILVNTLRAKIMNNAEDIFTALDNALLYTWKLPDFHSKARDLISLSLLVQKIRNADRINPINPVNLEGFQNLQGLLFANREKPDASGSFQTVHGNLSAISSQLLNKAKLIAENLQDNRIASYASGYLGQIYESEARYKEGVSLTRKAIFLAQQGYYPEILYLWQWQMGRLFKAAGDTESAVKAYNVAISTLNPVRHEFFTGYRYKKDIFDKKVKPVYSELADLLLNQSETGDRPELLYEARDKMELLKTAELQDFFRDECVSAVKKEPPDRSHPRTAVIYPVSLPDRLALLMILPEGMKLVNVPVDSETLRENAERFLSRLRGLHREKRIRYYGKKLYNWLIGPAEAELSAQEIDTLIIAPDGLLRLIPFSALHDGTHYLVEKYALATIPAITLTDFEPIELKDARILLAGLSQEADPPLKNVEKELEDIRMIMKQGRIVLDKDFTNDNLSNEFSGHEYTVVHISTHGNFGDDPADTYLQTYPGRKLTMDDLEKLIRLGRFRDNKVDLLSLSACRTAEGNERAALGLAGVAVKAGVRSAIASLWSVEANASSLLMTEFYRQLNTGISKAKALQNAQKKFIIHSDYSDYSHPAYWALFLLIGNWL